MAVLAIAGIGAAVGWGIGGTATAMAIGWTVGSYVGSYLFPTQLPDVEGPRVTDLSASTSAYGLVRTRIFGTVGLAGNLIWSDELTEIRNEDEVSGGKGGGGSSQTVVSYTYTVTCAWALCEGPVDAVRRIWFDAELVYDARDTNTGIVIKDGVNLRIYTGTETQGPDPSIQQIEGVGNTPAYRGTCYIVVQDLLLTDYGNRRPNVRAEVLRQGAVTNPATPIGAYSQNYLFLDNQTGWLCAVNLVTDTAVVWDAASGVVIAEWPLQQSALGPLNLQTAHNGIAYGDGWYDGNNQYLAAVDMISGQVLWQSGSYGIGAVITGRIEAHDQWLCRIGVLNQSIEVYEYNGDGSVTYVGGITNHSGGAEMSQVEPDTGYVWGFFSNYANNVGISLLTIDLNPEWPYFSPIKWLTTVQSHSLLDYFDSAGQPTSPLHTGVKADNLYHSAYYFDYDPATQSPIMVQYDDDGGTALPRGLYRIQCATRHNLNTMFIAASNTDVSPNPGATWSISTHNEWANNGNQLTGDGRVYYITAGSRLAVFNSYDMSLETSYEWPTLPNNVTGTVAASWAARTFYSFVILNGQYKLQWDRWGEEGMGLDQVVQEICEAHSLEALEFDVTDLATKSVKGFAIGRPTKARTQIEALMGAYFFDAVESDKKLKFRLRDNTSLITIPEGDLAAHEPGRQLPDAVMLKRKELYQIPQTVQVTHMSAALEYEPSSQYARQPTSPTADVLKLEFPLVLADDEAAQIAEIWMQALRAERHTATVVLGPKYLEYDPTDIITVQNNGLQYQFRLLKTALGGLPGIMKAEVSTYDVGAYVSNARGSSPIGYFGSTLNQAPISGFFMINSPPLRDTDDDGGFYYVVSPYADANNWPGSVAKRRDPTEPSTTLMSFGTQFNRATVGYEVLEVALPAGPNATTWDWENSLTVRLWNFQIDSLATETEIDVLNGRNLIYFPQTGELMQFRIATDNGDDTWTLTGLLRGRRGTDVFMDEHVPGEPFVLITPTTLYKYTDVLSNIGRTFEYASVTLNTGDNRAPKQTWTQSGGLITPLSPVALKATRQANGDLLLEWVRRARLNAEWLDNVDVPLDEPTEEYDVELYQDVTLLRTVRVIGQSRYTYTAAEQNTDTGSGVVGQFNMIVYQISSRVGRGQPGYLEPIRETVATNFSEYALFETPPLNWTRVNNGTWTIETGGADQVVEVVRGSAGHAYLRWARVTPARDVEALIKTATTLNSTTGGTGTQSIHGVTVRAQAIGQTGYLAGFWGDTGTASLVYKNNGSKGYTTLFNHPTKKATTGTFWWVRLRAQGNEIKVKWWNSADAEPSGWDFEAVDTSELNAGDIMLAGAYEYWGGPEEFDFFSCAYDGRTAPSTV